MAFIKAQKLEILNWMYEAEAIYSLTVDSNNALLLLHHAIVLNDLSHVPLYNHVLNYAFRIAAVI